MIQEVTLRNFKGVAEGTISLSPLTIFLGSNNAAKSTILEALFLGPNPFRPVPYYIQNMPNYPSKAIETLLYLHKTLDYEGYAFLLHNYNSKKASIEFKTQNKFLEEKDKPFLLRIFNQSNSLYFNINRPLDVSPVRINDEVVRYFGQASLNSNSISYSLEDTFFENTLLINPKLMRAGYEYLRREWASIVNSRISREVAREISNLSFEKYIDFTMEPIIGGQLDINAYLEDGRRIRLGDLGEGIQSYLLTRLLFEIGKPDVLLWDDMEAHLNPKMLVTLASWFKELISKGKQVIISTHSLELAEVIGGINEEETKILLNVLKEAKLSTKSLTLEELLDYKNSGIDARTAEALL